MKRERKSKMKVIKILIIILFLGISIKTNAQSCVIDTNFINKVLEQSYLEDGHYYREPGYIREPDYFLVLRVKYGEVEKYIIATNQNFVSFCQRYFHISNLTAKEFIKDALLNNKSIVIPNRKSKSIKKKDRDIYNYLSDVPQPDSTMLSLSNDKEAFLNYYFDENHIYKRKFSFQTNDDDINYIHKIVVNDNAVIAQLFRWGIPVYWSDEDNNWKYD
ncbi:MAG: hypothetical protein LBL74_04510 [Bacteroidales bacterium]|jgi:hypothetical protein|nr:hypothetical protein [Bacteroidales bacterium]